jgi:hypothetical protein
VNAETFDHAVDLVMHEKLIAREAGHAAAAMLLGLPVRSVEARSGGSGTWTIQTHPQSPEPSVSRGKPTATTTRCARPPSPR